MNSTTMTRGILAVSPLILLTMTGCLTGAKDSFEKFVTSLNVSEPEPAAGADATLKFSANLATGNIALTGFSLPIANPATPNVSYGTMALEPGMPNEGANTATLTLTTDITSLTKLAASEGSGAQQLPNGTALPLANLGTTPVISVPVGTSGAVLYFAFNGTTAILGTSIAFSALDKIGNEVPGVDLFEPFSLNEGANQYSLIAGIFGGSTAKSTGIALFVDVSKNVLAAISSTPAPTQSSPPSTVAAQTAAAVSTTLDHVSSAISQLAIEPKSSSETASAASSRGFSLFDKGHQHKHFKPVRGTFAEEFMLKEHLEKFAKEKPTLSID